MQVCVLHKKGDLRLEEREVAPLGPSEVRVKVGAGGICGSDLHYYYDGAVGDFAVREPLILGHEVAGEVVETGAAVTRVAVGERVAVNPSQPCWDCPGCHAGRTNLCRRMTFYGSAAVVPHVQGAFRELLSTDERQCFGVPKTLPVGIAAMAEPLAVCLHAVNRAGPLMGRAVLITGSGPIGALTCLAARHAGAAHLTMTDVAEAPLEAVRALGADATVNVGADPDGLAALARDKGRIDVAFEASGNGRALANALDLTRPGGVIVQIGALPPGGTTLAVNKVMAKEIDLRGTFRFHDEFALAVRLLAEGRIDPAPLLTAQLPVAERDAAFALARDRERAMKVQLVF